MSEEDNHGCSRGEEEPLERSGIEERTRGRIVHQPFHASPSDTRPPKRSTDPTFAFVVTAQLSVLGGLAVAAGTAVVLIGTLLAVHRLRSKT